MEDKRAHERLDGLEKTIAKHLEDHAKFEIAIQQIADNTSELVTLFKGAKGLRAFIMWLWPFLLVIGALFAGAMAYLKGAK